MSASNLPFDEWTGVYDSERLNGALLDLCLAKANTIEPGCSSLCKSAFIIEGGGMTVVHSNTKQSKQPRRQRSNSKRKPKQTAHRRAAANPGVMELIARLRRRWKRIKREERRRLLKDLLDRGCSRRGLAADIHRPESVVRYCLKPRPEKRNPKAPRAPIFSKDINSRPATTPAKRSPGHEPPEMKESRESLRRRAPQLITEFIRAKLGSPDTPEKKAWIQRLFVSLRYYASLAPNLTRPIHLPESITIPELHELTKASLLLDPEVLGKWLAVLLYSLQLRPTQDVGVLPMSQ